MPPREVAASTLATAARRPRCPWELARTQSVRSLAQTLARLFAAIGAKSYVADLLHCRCKRSLVGSLVRFLWIPGASLLPASFARASRDRCASGGVNRGATIACGAREAKRFSRGAGKKSGPARPLVTCTRVPACGACGQNCSGCSRARAAHTHRRACPQRAQTSRMRDIAASASGRAGGRLRGGQPAVHGAHAPRAPFRSLTQLDRVTDAVPEQRACDRRLVRDDVFTEMVLAVAENPVGNRVAPVLEHDLRAEARDPLAVFRVLDEPGAGNAALQRGRARLGVALLELRGVVLGVLLEVAELARALDRLRDRRLQLAIEILELALEQHPCRARHHRHVEVLGLLADLAEERVRLLLAVIEDPLLLVGHPDACDRVERREQEAVGRVPLPEQHAEFQARLVRRLHVPDHALELAAVVDPAQHLLAGRGLRLLPLGRA